MIWVSCREYYEYTKKKGIVQNGNIQKCIQFVSFIEKP